MLINLSNHPSAKWTEEQMGAAHEQYGDVVDIPFPQVDPAMGRVEINQMAIEYLQQISVIAPAEKATVQVMGEMNLTFALVTLLKDAGYTCVASTSVREVYEEEPGKKTIFFKFVRFREY